MLASLRDCFAAPRGKSASLISHKISRRGWTVKGLDRRGQTRSRLFESNIQLQGVYILQRVRFAIRTIQLFLYHFFTPMLPCELASHLTKPNLLLYVLQCYQVSSPHTTTRPNSSTRVTFILRWPGLHQLSGLSPSQRGSPWGSKPP